MRKYNFYSILNIILSLFYTKCFHRNARLIRLPVSIRGNNNIKFGENFVTGRYCRIDALSNKKEQIVIGDNCQINDSVHIAAVEKVIIGENVLIASRVFITDHQHGKYSGFNQSLAKQRVVERELNSAPVNIESNVWLGEGVVILPGVTIGANSIIGANSVVTRNVPSNSISCGVPAKVIKVFDDSKSEWVIAT